MDFLYCAPTVFVIGNEYEILVNANENGLIGIEAGGKIYREENSGVLATEKNYAKIRVPQNILDKAKAYSVIYRKTIDRRAYFSLMAEEQRADFSFRPIEKTENIRVYHIADVHYRYKEAEETAGFFGDDTDLFVVNGDIGEVEIFENYRETSRFTGNISKGKIPVIFVRGNHDTRGKLAEFYTSFFPAERSDTFFSFSIGPLSGVVLDLGEDKPDDHTDAAYPNPDVYGGVNDFYSFRRRELEWLKSVGKAEKGKTVFAISHICPVQTTRRAGDCFDIERELYAEMNGELERLGVSFMLCGHIHSAYVLMPEDPKSLLKHDYPVIVGSEIVNEKTSDGETRFADIIGAAITVNKESVEVLFTNGKREITEKHVIKTEKR